MQIQESKVGACDIIAGRRPHGEALAAGRRVPVAVGHHRATDNERVTDPARETIDPPSRGRPRPRGVPMVTDQTRRLGRRGATGGQMGQLTGPTDPTATRTGRTPSRARVSSPTPRSASAARPARSPARSGTTTRATATSNCSGCPTTTPARSAPAPGGTSRSSSRTPIGSQQARESGRALVSLGMPDRPWRAEAVGGAATRPPVDITPPDTPEFRWLMSSDVCKHCTHAGCLDVCPTGPCSAPSSAPSSCRTTSATGAAPAWPAARSG